MYRESLPFLKEFVQSYPKSPLVKKAKQKIREAQAKAR
jgi:outer membrane protein assembly factor BamD (BamD/ComL family)